MLALIHFGELEAVIAPVRMGDYVMRIRSRGRQADRPATYWQVWYKREWGGGGGGGGGGVERRGGGL